MNNLKTIEEVSRTMKVDNSPKEGRKYEISANVKIEGEKATDVVEGVVKTLESEIVATFGCFGSGRMSLNVWKGYDAVEIAGEINAFVAECREGKMER